MYIHLRWTLLVLRSLGYKKHVMDLSTLKVDLIGLFSFARNLIKHLFFETLLKCLVARQNSYFVCYIFLVKHLINFIVWLFEIIHTSSFSKHITMSKYDWDTIRLVLENEDISAILVKKKSQVTNKWKLEKGLNYTKLSTIAHSRKSRPSLPNYFIIPCGEVDS